MTQHNDYVLVPPHGAQSAYTITAEQDLIPEGSTITCEIDYTPPVIPRTLGEYIDAYLRAGTPEKHPHT